MRNTRYQINISDKGAIWKSPDGGYGSVDGFSGPDSKFDVEINIFGSKTENTTDVTNENFGSFDVYNEYGKQMNPGSKKQQEIIKSVNSGEGEKQHQSHQESLGNLTPEQMNAYNEAKSTDQYNPSLRPTNTLIYETANSVNRWSSKGETEAKIAIGTAHTQRKKK